MIHLFQHHRSFIVTAATLFLLLSVLRPAKAQDSTAHFTQQALEAFEDHRFRLSLELYARADSAGYDFQSNPEHMLRRGMAAYHTESWTNAVRWLQDGAAGHVVLKPYAEHFIVRALLKQQQPAEAAALAEEALKRGDLQFLAGGMRLLAAEAYEALEQWAPAIRHRQRYLEGWTAPDRAGIWYAIARDYRAAGNVSEALQWYRRIIDQQILTGAALEASRDLIHWHQDTGTALSQDDWKRHGDVLYRHRLYTDVRKWSDAYKDSFPDGEHRDYMTVLHGRSLYYSNRYQDAVTALSAVDRRTAREEDLKDVTLFTARSFLALGQSDTSITLYEQFARDWPDHELVPEIWWKLGWIYEGRAAYDTARGFYEQNIGNPNEFQESSRWRMGFCDFKAGRYDAAIQQFELTRRKSVSELVQRMSLYWKGRALLAAGRPQEADTVFSAVLDAPMPDYYSFQAADRLRRAPLLPADTLRIPDMDQDVDNTTRNAIDQALTVGRIFTREFGEILLRREETRADQNLPVLWAVLRGYQNLGVSGRAMRLALLMRSRWYPGIPLNGDFPMHRAIYPHYHAELVRASTAGKVDPALLYAIMRRESAFDERALSHAGAMGLVQLLPTVARSIGKSLGMDALSYEDIFRPHNNIPIGVTLLRERLDDFGGFLPGAIASYNAGSSVVKRWIQRHGAGDDEIFIESLEYSETRNYVRNVLQDYWIYKLLYK